MSRVKCKSCTRYLNRICIWIDHRRRSAGKKRDCRHFVQRYVEPRTPLKAIYEKFVPRSERTKLKQQRKEDIKRLEAMEHKIEQRKLTHVAQIPSSFQSQTVTIKKPNVLNRIFRKICSGS